MLIALRCFHAVKTLLFPWPSLLLLPCCLAVALASPQCLPLGFVKGTAAVRGLKQAGPNSKALCPVHNRKPIVSSCSPCRCTVRCARRSRSLASRLALCSMSRRKASTPLRADAPSAMCAGQSVKPCLVPEVVVSRIMARRTALSGAFLQNFANLGMRSRDCDFSALMWYEKQMDEFFDVGRMWKGAAPWERQRLTVAAVADSVRDLLLPQSYMAMVLGTHCMSPPPQPAT